MKKLISFAAITSLFLAAQASAVTWYVAGGSGVSSSYDFLDTTGTYQLTATASSYNPLTGTNSAWVSRDTFGLGVRNSIIDDSEIDGSPFGLSIDTLHIDLGAAFNVYRFLFGSIQSNDTVVVEIDSSEIFNGNPYSVGLSNGAGTYFVDIAGTVGQYLDFSVAGSNDDYRLKQIDADLVPTDSVPDSGSTVAILGLGILGLACARRRLGK